MASDALTAEEFATWVRAGEARERLTEALGKASPETSIVERLRGGAIRTAAKEYSVEASGEVRRGFYPLIPPFHWIKWSASSAYSDLWGLGDIRIALDDSRGLGRTMILRYLGVRLDPAAFDAWLADLPPRHERKHYWRPKPKPEPAAPTLAPTIEESEEPRGPAVADDHLERWFDLYRRAYVGSQDTEATALKSARGMFPGKSVSRDKVRGLRGTQKVGRKPTDIKG